MMKQKFDEFSKQYRLAFFSNDSDEGVSIISPDESLLEQVPDGWEIHSVVTINSNLSSWPTDRLLRPEF